MGSAHELDTFGILLASTSPRRRALLEEARLPYTLVEPGAESDGTPVEARDPRAFAVARAREKALGAQLQGASAGLLLAVDTVVTLDGVLYGKPRDERAARQTLRCLGGRVHEVMTAHCTASIDAQDGRASGRVDAWQTAVETVVSVSRVAMRALSEDELADYIAAGDWRDKAGAYGIQSDAKRFTTLERGRLDTVIGLDVSVVRAAYDRAR